MLFARKRELPLFVTLSPKERSLVAQERGDATGTPRGRHRYRDGERQGEQKPAQSPSPGGMRLGKGGGAPEGSGETANSAHETQRGDVHAGTLGGFARRPGGIGLLDATQ